MKRDKIVKKTPLEEAVILICVIAGSGFFDLMEWKPALSALSMGLVFFLIKKRKDKKSFVSLKADRK